MQILKMDFQSQSAPPIVPVMQSDSRSRFIGIALYNGGSPYEAPEGAVYTVQYRGPGANNIGWYDTIRAGTESHTAVTVDTTSKHIVTLELAPQALQRAGDVHVNLCVMTDGGYTLRTFDIIARVNAAAYPDEVAVASYFYLANIGSVSWLSYLTSCQEAQQNAQQAASTADTAASSAKNSAENAETAAGNAQADAAEARQAASQIKYIANGCLGYYETAAALREAYPTADAGSWAIVAEKQTIFVWNPSTQAWKDASVDVDVSDFYTKSEADKLFTPTASGINTALGYDLSAKLTRLERMMNMDGKLVYTDTGVANSRPNTMTIPDGVDYIRVRKESAVDASSGVNIARGGAAKAMVGSSSYNAIVLMTFAADGTLTIAATTNSGSSDRSFNVEGYQYL